MNRTLTAFFAIAIAVSSCLFLRCSSSAKETSTPIDPGVDSAFSNITKYDISPVDSINYASNCITYLSGRLRVIVTNLDKKEISFQHDYTQMPSYMGYEDSSRFPAVTYWLDNHHLIILDWFNYSQINLNYNLWSIVDISQNSHVDQIICAGSSSDTTFCSFPFPWYKNSIVASISHKGQNEAIVYDTQLKVKYRTNIAANMLQLESFLGNEVFPFSYSEYIDYNSFPALISRNNLNGSATWKSSASAVFYKANLMDHSDPVPTKTDTEFNLTIKGHTQQQNDTTMIFRFDLATGKLL